MSEIKQPQDHLQKAEKPKVETVDVTFGEGDTKRVVAAKRTTIRGITVTVTNEALDDFELLDDLQAAETGNAARLPSLLRRLLGDGYKAAMDGLRDPVTGRVPVAGDAGGVQFIKELLVALNPNS